MPMLYEGRQHKRSGRESLDCALALQELAGMGVENIITFDAHDPRVSNAIPLKSFENVATNYQMIKALIREVPDIKIDKDHLTIISPDEGGLGRCIYYSSVLELELGMFYKRRDYSQIVDGRNKIISHEYLGSSLEGKDVIIVDDMISSGDSMIDVAKQLKARNANRVFICSAFGLFCNGLETFDEAYEQGLITKVLTTNTIYRSKKIEFVRITISIIIDLDVRICNRRNLNLQAIKVRHASLNSTYQFSNNTTERYNIPRSTSNKLVCEHHLLVVQRIDGYGCDVETRDNVVLTIVPRYANS
jgi:ribose-phosphate pyrophosphokinase